MSDFEVYMHAKTESAWRWAERENADARHQLAKINERKAMLMSQYEPINSMGIDREKIRHILNFLIHGDINRLYAESGVEKP